MATFRGGRVALTTVCGLFAAILLGAMLVRTHSLAPLEGGWRPADHLSAPKIPGPDTRFTDAQARFGLRVLTAASDGGRRNALIAPAGLSGTLAILANGCVGPARQQILCALESRAMPLNDLNLRHARQFGALGPDAPGAPTVYSVRHALRMPRAARIEPMFLQAAGPYLARFTPDAPDAGLHAACAAALRFQCSPTLSPTLAPPRPFTGPDGRARMVPMVQCSGPLLLAHRRGAQMVGVPCADGRTRLLLLMPDRPGGLPDALARLDTAEWSACLAEMRPREVILMMPRLRLRDARRMDGPLKAMGMRAAFDPERACFGALCSQPIRLISVRHEVSLETREPARPAGTVPGPGRAGAVRLTVDRPFLCAVRDEPTGALLLLGAVTEP